MFSTVTNEASNFYELGEHVQDINGNQNSSEGSSYTISSLLILKKIILYVYYFFIIVLVTFSKNEEIEVPSNGNVSSPVTSGNPKFDRNNKLFGIFIYIIMILVQQFVKIGKCIISCYGYCKDVIDNLCNLILMNGRTCFIFLVLILCIAIFIRKFEKRVNMSITDYVYEYLNNLVRNDNDEIVENFSDASYNEFELEHELEQHENSSSIYISSAFNGTFECNEYSDTLLGSDEEIYNNSSDPFGFFIDLYLNYSVKSKRILEKLENKPFINYKDHYDWVKHALHGETEYFKRALKEIERKNPNKNTRESVRSVTQQNTQEVEKEEEKEEDEEEVEKEEDEEKVEKEEGEEEVEKEEEEGEVEKEEVEQEKEKREEEEEEEDTTTYLFEVPMLQHTFKIKIGIHSKNNFYPRIPVHHFSKFKNLFQTEFQSYSQYNHKVKSPRRCIMHFIESEKEQIAIFSECSNSIVGTTEETEDEIEERKEEAEERKEEEEEIKEEIEIFDFSKCIFH